jgi:hypothetical protein
MSKCENWKRRENLTIKVNNKEHSKNENFVGKNRWSKCETSKSIHERFQDFNLIVLKNRTKKTRKRIIFCA